MGILTKTSPKLTVTGRVAIKNGGRAHSTSFSSNRTGPIKASGSRTSSCLCPREAARKRREVDESQSFVEVLGGEVGVTTTRYFMLATQPPAQPSISVSINRAICFAEGTQAKIIGPATEHSVQPFHHLLGIEQARSAVRLLVDFADQAFDALRSHIEYRPVTLS